jgi:phosphohistidine phosphatase
LKVNCILPDQVLSSSSGRTRETFIRLDLAADAQADFTRDLYLASEDQILNALQNATGECVPIVGHNPGIGMCAEGIVATAPTHPQFHLCPTSATLVADFDIDDWSDARWGKAIARHYVVPRDL